MNHTEFQVARLSTLQTRPTSMARSSNIFVLNGRTSTSFILLFHVSITFHKFSIFRITTIDTVLVPECIRRTKASWAKLMSALSS